MTTVVGAAIHCVSVVDTTACRKLLHNAITHAVKSNVVGRSSECKVNSMDKKSFGASRNVFSKLEQELLLSMTGLREPEG